MLISKQLSLVRIAFLVFSFSAIQSNSFANETLIGDQTLEAGVLVGDRALKTVGSLTGAMEDFGASVGRTVVRSICKIPSLASGAQWSSYIATNPEARCYISYCMGLITVAALYYARKPLGGVVEKIGTWIAGKKSKATDNNTANN